MPRTAPEFDAGWKAAREGQPCEPPADYNDQQRQYWLSGYSLAKSPIAKPIQ